MSFSSLNASHCSKFVPFWVVLFILCLTLVESLRCQVPSFEPKKDCHVTFLDMISDVELSSSGQKGHHGQNARIHVFLLYHCTACESLEEPSIEFKGRSSDTTYMSSLGLVCYAVIGQYCLLLPYNGCSKQLLLVSE